MTTHEYGGVHLPEQLAQTAYLYKCFFGGTMGSTAKSVVPGRTSLLLLPPGILSLRFRDYGGERDLMNYREAVEDMLDNKHLVLLRLGRSTVANMSSK
jgi:hypothetical protein